MTTAVRIAVVGAGFAGLGAALRLREAGEDSFVVIERAEAIGGTWRDNVYPGVACDIPAHLYSFSFLPHPGFTRRFAPGAEILAYLERAAAPVRDRIRLGTELLDARWDESEERWRLSTSQGPISAEFLVLACGRLTEPRLPEVVGRFDGPVVHSARWDDDLVRRAERIAVIGTGASAVQLIPHLARRGARLTVFQRSAPYVLPREDRPHGPDERRLFAESPKLLARLREELFDELDAGHAARTDDLEARARLRDRALAHLARQVPDAAVRAALTPSDEFGCKRPLFSDDYYPALLRPNVELVASALAAYDGGAVVTAQGARFDVDLVVAATGFEAARQPYARVVRGRAGRRLCEHWSTGMRAFASTTVHGFPNLFVLDGPNASLGHHSAVVMIETQISYVLGALRHLGQGVLEARADAEQAYAAEMAERSSTAVWMSGCSNWYRDPRTGGQVLLWPGTAAEFVDRFSTFDPTPYHIRQRAHV